MNEQAPLWQRILFEGVDANLGYAHLSRQLGDMIVRAPILVDRRPADPADAVQRTPSMLTFPFPRFWIEGRNIADVPVGAMVTAKQQEGGWHLGMVCVLGLPEVPAMAIGEYSIRCDARGLPDMGTEGILLPAPMQRFPQKSGRAVVAISLMACDTLELLACRNVGLERRWNDKAATRIAKRKFGTSPHKYKYHILTLRPPGSKPGTRGVEIGNMPRHWCRGHFQHYGPAADHGHVDGRDRGLLFGKLAGKFFVPPIARGDVENGIVEKDYRVA